MIKTTWISRLSHITFSEISRKTMTAKDVYLCRSMIKWNCWTDRLVEGCSITLVLSPSDRGFAGTGLDQPDGTQFQVLLIRLPLVRPRRRSSQMVDSPAPFDRPAPITQSREPLLPSLSRFFSFFLCFSLLFFSLANRQIPLFFLRSIFLHFC